jgi:putative MATE family efflux protein
LPFFCRERFSRVAALALPAALGALIDMTQVMIDFFFVGFIDVFSTAAIGVALQFMGLFYTLMGVFFIGSNAMMSRFLGAGDAASASKVFSTFAVVSLTLSVPAFFIATNLTESLFHLIDSDARVTRLGASYLYVMAFALPSMMVNQIAFSAFSAAADIKTPLYIKIFSNIVNVGLSYALIFGVESLGVPSFGVAGAAAATVAAFYLETICYGYLLYAKKRPFAPRFAIERDLFRRGIKIGLPAGVERLFLFGSFIFFMGIVNSFGAEAMAGYQVGLRVESLAFMPGIGFTIAAMSLTGRSLGANNPAEAEKDALFTAMLAASIMGAIGIVMVAFAAPLSSIFTRDEAAIEAATGYLICVGLSQIPLGVGFVLSGAFRGAGDTKTSLYINFIAMWLLRIIPAIALATYFENVWFVWLATLVETWICGLWLYLVFRRGKWKTVKV